MTRALQPLSMSAIAMLPLPCRSCVAWELPEDAAVAAELTGSSGFEKEVWLSGVMLTWGSAGQVVTVDGEPAGFALFAPPPAVPGAAAFPSGPVSPDAVLLTAARISAEHRGQGLARYLLTGVFAELSRRGVRAVELFARADGPGDPTEPAEGEPKAEEEPELPAPSTTPRRCTVSESFARAIGFEVVRADPHYPRMRYELTGGIGWKAEVEAALERLFEVITVPAAPARAPEPASIGVGNGVTVATHRVDLPPRSRPECRHQPHTVRGNAR